ncbi:HtaA domain-containing protein [Streptomyces sp. NPDC089424]|uniref:HtaA domain-containing protein n=1 Tax=Streptomyces sp. NPDC089424 TaxID=3365917 RepID=UPI003807A985
MSARPRRRTAALAAAVATAATLGATALATVGAPAAAAAEVPLSDYTLTWGIKQSYRSYVTGMAAGTFTPSDGASQAANNGAFTFTDGAGGYDPTTHTVDLAFRGALKIESTAHRFELGLSDIRFDSAAAEITADVTRSGTTTQDVPLAEVAVTRAMTEMATTLTKEAADVFGSASYEGAAGDPLTVAPEDRPSPSPSATATGSPTATASPSPTATASPSSSPTASPSPTASTSPSASASPSAPARGDIADGTLTWGVKESFRAYVVTGPARGAITVSGGAGQAPGNGEFTFVDATGGYDADAGTLSAAFEGAVNFKGHKEGDEYGLDLTLEDLRTTFDGGTGELTADVTSLGETTQDVPLADLTARSSALAPEDDVITLDDVTARLTSAGAEAFGGFYTAGTELDPVDVAIALTDDAQLPDGDDPVTPSPSDTSAATTSGGVTGSTTGGAGGSLATTGSEAPVGALGTAAAVTVVAGAGVVVAMRRRRSGA